MLSEGTRVLAAVSGGADSMCMLHLLWEMSQKQGFFLAAATFDHKIRAEGEADAAFVAQWCRERGISCVCGSGDVPAYARSQRLGLEESARILRYEFLRETAQRLGCTRIATAHNANDNAETILLHLMRGTGLRGLGGIAPVQKEVIRPILCCTRQEIEDYLREKNIPHVEDATNADTAYSRNYLRHEVLPLLTAKNPSLLTGLLRMSKGLRQDEEYLTREAEKLAQMGKINPDSVSFSASWAAELPDAMFHRVIQLWIEHLSPETVLSGRSRGILRRLCSDTTPSARANLPGGLRARRGYDLVILERETKKEPCQPVTLAPGETVTFGGRELSCQWSVCPGGRFNQPHAYYLKASEAPLLLRSRRTGDQIKLPSRDRKTVKKLLIDSKVPLEQRERIAVLELEGRVAAVDGFGADQAFLPEKDEKCWFIQSKIEN